MLGIQESSVAHKHEIFLEETFCPSDIDLQLLLIDLQGILAYCRTVNGLFDNSLSKTC